MSAFRAAWFIAAAAAGAAALAGVVGCGPEPLPDPPQALLDIRVRAYYGSPLSGPVPLTGEIEDARRSPLAAVRVWAVASFPDDVLEPLSARAAVVVREPLPTPEAVLGPLARARAGLPADPEALVASLSGPAGTETRFLGAHTLALPPGVTVALDATALRVSPDAAWREGSLLLHRPKQDVPRIDVALAVREQPDARGGEGGGAVAEAPPGSGAGASSSAASPATGDAVASAAAAGTAGAAGPAGSTPPRAGDAAPALRWTAETALLDPLPFTAPRAGRLGALPEPRSPALAVILPAPAVEHGETLVLPEGHRVAAALLVLIEVRAAPSERDPLYVAHHTAWRAALEDVRRQAVAVTAEGERASPALTAAPSTAGPGAVLDVDACLRALREPPDPTRALLRLGRAVGAEELVALALAMPEALAHEIAQTIASAAFGADGRRTSRDQLRLLADRAAVEVLASAALDHQVPPAVDAIACRYAGALARKPQDLIEICRAAETSEALVAGVLAANRAALRDASSTVRVRAWRWLFERGESIPGYHPLGSAETRRAALKAAAAGSARTGGGL